MMQDPFHHQRRNAATEEAEAEAGAAPEDGESSSGVTTVAAVNPQEERLRAGRTIYVGWRHPSHIECLNIFKPLCAKLLRCAGLRRVCAHFKQFM